jgi:hypothetical protein
MAATQSAKQCSCRFHFLNLRPSGLTHRCHQNGNGLNAKCGPWRENGRCISSYFTVATCPLILSGGASSSASSTGCCRACARPRKSARGCPVAAKAWSCVSANESEGREVVVLSVPNHALRWSVKVFQREVGFRRAVRKERAGEAGDFVRRRRQLSPHRRRCHAPRLASCPPPASVMVITGDPPAGGGQLATSSQIEATPGCLQQHVHDVVVSKEVRRAEAECD